VSQAHHFSLSILETIYHRLLNLDESIKTGQIEELLALDTFIAGFTV
jgi:DNA polymerase III delta subunit